MKAQDSGNLSSARLFALARLDDACALPCQILASACILLPLIPRQRLMTPPSCHS
jgi:hypothetical protein